MNTTVPTPEPKGYAVTAAELRRIADAIERLPGAPSHVAVDFQTAPAKGTNEEIAAGVDAVAMAVIGRPGEDRDLSGGGSQRHVGDWTNQVGGQTLRVAVYQMYVRPDPKDAEIERLRSELAKLHAETDPTGDSFSREPDEVKPTSAVPNGIDGHSEFSGRASVPDPYCGGE